MSYHIINLRLLLLFLLVISCLSTFSQKPPIKFGEVPLEDLEMTFYPADTAAVAVILCDYGYFNSEYFQFTRLLRIKIFHKEGLQWGNFVFPSSPLTTVKGYTTNLENGEVVKTKLKDESVFKERVTEDLYRIRTAMPNLKEGSVIDLEFKFPGLPTEWRFQQTIPVRWSELIIEKSNNFEFRRSFSGIEPLSINTPTRWVGKDMPAFKEEPYISSITNYISKFDIELLYFKSSGRGLYPGLVYEFSSTWGKVNERLMNSSYFGVAMQGCAFLNSIATSIESVYHEPIHKLYAAHQAIANTIHWNEDEALWISGEDLRTPFKKKIGNSAEVNLMLIQLINKLGLKVYPVALSTRSNGYLSPIYPSLRKLNYVVAYVIIDGKGYFADATEPFLPVGMLPYRCINLNGRIIDLIDSDWINLIPETMNKKIIQCELSLTHDLQLTGKMVGSYLDYAAYDLRKEFSGFNSEEEYITHLENKLPGLEIQNYSMTGIDSIYSPVNQIFDVRLKNKITMTGNSILIQPILFDQVTDNPFKSEERNYPIDFTCPVETTYTLQLHFSDDYKIIEFPKPLILKLPDKSLSALYQVSVIGQTIQVTYKYKLTRTIFTEEEYGNMRAFYSELISKQAEPIIISKQ